MTPSVSILIPAYNEEEALPAVLAHLLAAPALADAEIIVVDDGSIDGTAAAVAGCPRVRLLRHSRNRGYGAALRTAAEAASSELVAWFDADGQHRVEDLVTVIQTARDGALDYCIGVRDAESDRVVNRRLGKLVLRCAVNWAASQRVPDFNSGLRVFRRSVLLRYLHLLPKGYGASTTTTLLMLERGYHGGYVPIRVLERVGKSTVRQWRDGCRTLVIILRIVLLFRPLRFFGMLGAALLVAGLGYGVWNALATRTGMPTLSVGLMLLGAQALFFGLIADQLGALRRERFER